MIDNWRADVALAIADARPRGPQSVHVAPDHLVMAQRSNITHGWIDSLQLPRRLPS